MTACDTDYQGLEGHSIYNVLLAATKGRLLVPITPDRVDPERLQSQHVFSSQSSAVSTAGSRLAPTTSYICLCLHLPVSS